MIVLPSMQEDEIVTEEGSIHLSVLYPITEYQEILNVQDFDFNSMFSGVGGFVGIFLGYSLLFLSI